MLLMWICPLKLNVTRIASAVLDVLVDGMATTLLVKGVDGKYIAALKNSFKKTTINGKEDQEFDIVEQTKCRVVVHPAMV